MRGIFLDRDGVINVERADYVKQWSEFQFLPRALPALRRLATLNLPIAVITNQSAIGRGLVELATIEEIHQRALSIIQLSGGRIDAFFMCPHHPEQNCACRKPKPGLLHQAADVFGIATTEWLFIGDAITDYQAARAAGCRSLLVESGRQGAQLRGLCAADAQVTFAKDLADAVNCILTE